MTLKQALQISFVVYNTRTKATVDLYDGDSNFSPAVRVDSAVSEDWEPYTHERLSDHLNYIINVTPSLIKGAKDHAAHHEKRLKNAIKELKKLNNIK